MNNEEKILTLLEKHDVQFEKINSILEKHVEMLGQLTSDMADVKGRLDRLEESQAEMQTTLTKVAVTQENIVLPRLQLLAEGHDNLLDKLASKSRVEALEDDMALMKTVIRTLSQEVAELKKAQ